MRFLLHATKRTPRRLASKALEVQQRAAEKAPVVTHSSSLGDTSTQKMNIVQEENINTTLVKAWGQQCSERCGCVVRFESEIDADTDKIASTAYHAKTILTTMVDGKLEPQLTSRTHRPLLKECTCPTLHHLASSVASSITCEKLASVRNMTEFGGVRSSTAFRRTVLNSHKLPSSDTHCFDLVEEAFSAMVRGHMPSPRKENDLNRKKVMAQAVRQAKEQDATAATTASPRNFGYGVDRNSGMSVASAHAMSALYLMDVDTETSSGAPVHIDEHPVPQEDEEVEPDGVIPIRDWVAYVDEIYRLESEQESLAKQRVERSA